MKRTITSITAGLFLFFSSLQAQTTCSDDRVAYVNSKNIPSTTGAYTLSIGAEEKASQAYHYSGPGKVGGARVYGDVLSLVGVKLKVSLYNVDANDRPTGSAYHLHLSHHFLLGVRPILMLAFLHPFQSIQILLWL